MLMTWGMQYSLFALPFEDSQVSVYQPGEASACAYVLIISWLFAHSQAAGDDVVAN